MRAYRYHMDGKKHSESDKTKIACVYVREALLEDADVLHIRIFIQINDNKETTKHYVL